MTQVLGLRGMQLGDSGVGEILAKLGNINLLVHGPPVYRSSYQACAFLLLGAHCLSCAGDSSTQAPKLRVLDLGENQLSVRCTAALASVITSRPLETLMLDANTLGTLGAAVLADALQTSRWMLVFFCAQLDG